MLIHSETKHKPVAWQVLILLLGEHMGWQMASSLAAQHLYKTYNQY